MAVVFLPWDVVVVVLVDIWVVSLTACTCVVHFDGVVEGMHRVVGPLDGVLLSAWMVAESVWGIVAVLNGLLTPFATRNESTLFPSSLSPKTMLQF